MGILSPTAFAQLMSEMARAAVADPSWGQLSPEFRRYIDLEYDRQFSTERTSNMAMQVKGGVAKKGVSPFGGKKKEKSKDSPAGPGAMPHRGGKNCPCPNCKDKRK